MSDYLSIYPRLYFTNLRRLRLADEKKEERKKETTGQKYNGLPYYVGRPQ